MHLPIGQIQIVAVVRWKMIASIVTDGAALVSWQATQAMTACTIFILQIDMLQEGFLCFCKFSEFVLYSLSYSDPS